LIVQIVEALGAHTPAVLLVIIAAHEPVILGVFTRINI
jgi:hypothetical protein